MGKPSKFSKLAGPQKVLYASLDAATPTLASDTVVFLQSGTAKKVTFANMMGGIDGTASSTGLKATNGVLAVDITDLDAKTAPVAADSIMLNDSENSNTLKEVTLTNLAKPLSTTMAGTGLMDATGSIALDLDGCGDAVVDVALDTIAFIDESATGDPTKLTLISGLVEAMRGTTSATGLSSSNGVLTVAAKIAHLVAGEASSLFFFADEFDFSGSADLVATKISDHAGATALAAKGTLIAAFVAVTQVANGTTTDVISIAKDGTPTAKLCGDCTITIADVTNKVGCNFMLMPVTGANAVVDPASEDIYAVAAASAGRTAGKVYVFLVFQKTA